MIIFTLVGSMDPADKRSLYVPVATVLGFGQNEKRRSRVGEE